MKKNWLKYSSFILILIFVLSCAQITSLGLKKHQFGVQPSKIIWLQIAGLEEQHLSMLKYSYPSSEQKTEFEKFTCIGKLWNYNLYKLRKNSFASFKGQTTGSKNIKNTCDDFGNKPIWSYYKKANYATGLLESYGRNKTSLSSNTCIAQRLNYTDGLTTFVRSPYIKKSKNLYHHSEEHSFKENEVYFDRSCNKKGCFTSIKENAIALYKKITKNKNYSFFVLRDYSYERALTTKNYKRAKNILIDLNETIKFFRELTVEGDTLLIVSTSSPISLDFPSEGAQWKDWEKYARGVKIKNDNLLSTVWAEGARAENFCGFYDETDIVTRTLSGAKQQGLEFIFLNPFE